MIDMGRSLKGGKKHTMIENVSFKKGSINLRRNRKPKLNHPFMK